MKGHWRDDGVAFDWVLSRNNTGTNGTVKDNEAREVVEVAGATSPRAGERYSQFEEEDFIPLETQTTARKFIEPGEISERAQNSATATDPTVSDVADALPSSSPQMQQPNPGSQSGEKVGSASAIALISAPAKHSKAEAKWGPPIIGKPPATGPINRIYKYDIPVPKIMKAGGRFTPEFQVWKLRHRDEASCLDARGCPTREAFLNHNTAADCDILSMKVVPIDMSDPDSWPMTMFPEQVSVPIPASVKLGKEFEVWSAMICERVSEPDWKGRPTRWVRSLHTPSSTAQFKVKWRAKTREEIESYNGPAIFPSQASLLKLGQKTVDIVNNSSSSSIATPKAGTSAKLNQSLLEQQKKRMSSMLEAEAAEAAKSKRRTSESYFEREWDRGKRPGSPAFKEGRLSKMQKKDKGMDKSRERDKEKERERERERTRDLDREREVERVREREREREMDREAEGEKRDTALQLNSERRQSPPHYSSQSIPLCIRSRLIIFRVF